MDMIWFALVLGPCFSYDGPNSFTRNHVLPP